MAAAKAATIWVHSNRVDDRTVLWERDAMHPGGEAFIGGEGVACVGRTPAVEILLRDKVIVEVAEPKDDRKRPVVEDVNPPEVRADVPGQPVRLGRELAVDVAPSSDKAK